MAVTGTHRVAIDPLGFDLLAAAALQGIIEPQDDRPLGSEHLEHHTQQDLTEGAARPLGSVQHAVIVLEMPAVAQSHDRQDRGHRPFAGRQDRTHNQKLGMKPDRRGKYWREQRQQGSHFDRQVQPLDPRSTKC